MKLIVWEGGRERGRRSPAGLQPVVGGRKEEGAAGSRRSQSGRVGGSPANDGHPPVLLP